MNVKIQQWRQDALKTLNVAICQLILSANVTEVSKAMGKKNVEVNFGTNRRFKIYLHT